MHPRRTIAATAILRRVRDTTDKPGGRCHIFCDSWSTGTEAATPFAQVIHAGIEHDLTTQDPILYSPAASQTETRNDFQLRFALQENATLGSVKLQIDTLGLLDPTSQRLVVFSTDLNYEDEYAMTFTNLSLAVGELPEIVSVTPAQDLVHGEQYVLKVLAKDFLGNAEAQTFSGALEFDTFTEAPTLVQPKANFRFKELFQVEFQLPEEAAAGTVKLIFENTNTNPAGEGAGTHTIVLTIFLAGVTFLHNDRS